MKDIIDIAISIISVIGGIILTLVGFEIIKPKADIRNGEKKLAEWRKSFGIFFKYGGILITFIGIFALIAPESMKVTDQWTDERKNKLKETLLDAPPFIGTFQNDSLNMLIECFVEKYTQKYSPEGAENHKKLEKNEYFNVIRPLFEKCIENLRSSDTKQTE